MTTQYLMMIDFSVDSLVEYFSAQVFVYLTDDNFKGCFHISRVESRCFNKEQSFLFCKVFSVLYTHISDILQITLVPNKHSCNCCITMGCITTQDVSDEFPKGGKATKLIRIRQNKIEIQRKQKGLTVEFIKPSFDIVESSAPSDVINNESTHSASIISRSDSPKTFLTSSIPNLGLNFLTINFNNLRLKLNSNGGLRVMVKFITGKTGQQVGFANSRIPNHHNLEQILLFFLHFSSPLCRSELLNALLNSTLLYH
ncbi:hypothetical protein H5410_046934 [Solanum commersonii]|uniref:Uncharacterized protein n=1 Tax=Solanum commersonii TaxID=4109 RepID=A0A9J5XGW3_SOLCO|nr:hypothetical protein H5410_046934 [Solanum commersonii]